MAAMLSFRCPHHLVLTSQGGEWFAL